MLSLQKYTTLQVCIGTSSVEVYRPAGAFLPGAAKNMAAWPNCRQLQPPRSMNGDTFQCEEYKIRSFLSTLKGRTALGFPADAETIERWPLVQAHALEEMGMGGFLTQKHQVACVADTVRDALSYVDAHSFDCLAKLNVDMLAFHWRSVALQLDKPKTPWRRLDLTQADVGEPLESYFEFGDMQASAGAAQAKGRGARVRRPALAPRRAEARGRRGGRVRRRVRENVPCAAAGL